MKDEKKFILEGIFTNIPNPHHHNGRIYPSGVFQKYFKDELQTIKQKLRQEKIKRLYGL